jgi:hypothetical protein
MMKRLVVLVMLLAGFVFAQEGHPLVGSWHGSWTVNGKEHDATFVLKWDGKTISGLVNPGLDGFKVEAATLEPKTWTLHMEGTAKDESGKPVKVVIDTKMEHVTNVQRTMTGTWTQGGVKAPLKMKRDL